MTLVNHERLGRIAPLISLPHGCVRGLNVVCEPRRVEQWISLAIARQLGLDRSQEWRLAGELKRQRLIVRK